MKPRVVIIGASGHGLVLAEAIQISKKFELIGFLDSNENVIEIKNLPVPIFGSLNDAIVCVEKLKIDGIFLGIGDNFIRKTCFGTIRALVPSIQFPTLVHPAATIAPSAVLAEGAVVLAGAVVGTMAKIGCGVLINTLSSLDHHGSMASFSSLAPGVHTGGNVRIGEMSAVCLGVNILHGKTIGKNSVVGAGALVTKDIPDNVLAYGTPAKVIRNRQPREKYI